MAVLFTGLFYHTVWLHPNRYLFSSNGDAIKNYYTYSHYIRHSESWTEFNGMNYPYGELFLYTDCHPLLAAVLRGLVHFFPGLAPYDIGILNFLMITSLPLTAYVLFLVLCELRVRTGLAMWGALGMMALGPQVYRFIGHPALSYGFAVPLTLLWLLRFEHSPHKTRYVVYLFLGSLAWFFTHAYLGMICCTLVTVYAAFRFLAEALSKKITQPGRHLLLTAAGILPALLFFGFTKALDTRVGRNDNPWGIFELHATFESVFLPHDLPLGPWLKTLYPGITPKQDWEAWSYVGIASTLFFVWYAFVSLRRSWRTRKLRLDEDWMDSRPLRLLWLTSVAILTLAMLYPFRLKMERLVDFLPMIKQFRSIGRFAWVFYFISGISAVYLSDRLATRWLRSSKKAAAYGLLFLVPALFMVEGSFQQYDVSVKLTQSPNLFDLEQTDAGFRQTLASVNADEYQAILPLPYFHVGSETFTRQAPAHTYQYTELLAYHLRLPTLGCYLTRIPLWQSKNLLQLFSPNVYSKKIREDLPSDKPFLVLYTPDPLSPEEQYYLDRGIPVARHPEFSLYALEPELFFESTARQEWDSFESQKPALQTKNGFLVNDTNLFFYYEGFDAARRTPYFHRMGSYEGRMDEYHILARIGPGRLTANKPYTVRFWMYNGGRNYGQGKVDCMVFMRQRNETGEKWFGECNPANSLVIDGDWSMAEFSFMPDRADVSYELAIKDNRYNHETFYVDDVLIYEPGLTIYRQEADALFKNNHRIARPAKNP